ncbi:MAG: hypothetical protein Phog2KO_20430 [Phototrophicaceae bacterium]
MLVSEERPEVENDLAPSFEDTETSSAKPKNERPSLWETIRRFFFATSAEKRDNHRLRLTALTSAIDMYPLSAANYVLRGELHLELKQMDLAQEDFEQAIVLAEEQYQQDRWGLGSQAILDRARYGLQQIVR